MLRFCDPGGRVYGVVGTSYANLANYWSTVSTNLSVWVVHAATGRIGNASLRNTNRYVNGNYIIKTLDAQSIWGAALAFKINGTAVGSVPGILAFWDSGSPQIDLRCDRFGYLYFTRNDTMIGTLSTTPLSIGNWDHIEVKVTIDSTSGSIECRLNNLPVIGPITSINTQHTGNASANQFLIGNSSSLTHSDTSTADFDDIVVWDGQTTDPQGNADIHDFIGDCYLSWLLPNANGHYVQFIPSAGSNYSCVNDTTVDDTSYVTGDLNNIDSYIIPTIGTSQIKSIAVIDYVKKSNAMSRTFKSLLRISSTDYLAAADITLDTAYAYTMQNWGSNPNTLVAWTTSDVNALEIGQKVYA